MGPELNERAGKLIAPLWCGMDGAKQERSTWRQHELSGFWLSSVGSQLEDMVLHCAVTDRWGVTCSLTVSGASLAGRSWEFMARCTTTGHCLPGILGKQTFQSTNSGRFVFLIHCLTPYSTSGTKTHNSFHAGGQFRGRCWLKQTHHAEDEFVLFIIRGYFCHCRTRLFWRGLL